MQNIKKFEKVSFLQFEKDIKNISIDENAKDIYNDLILPKRATKFSAGYDFFAPFNITLKPGETVMIPTGIRARMNDENVLLLFPRSGLGFKFRFQLNNTIGVIDSDYYNAENEGHIMCRMTNDTNENKILEIKKGQGFVQGIFLEYGITVDDDVKEIRKGGFGSTTK